MDLRSFIDLPRVRESTFSMRRRALAATSVFLLVVYAIETAPMWGLLAGLAALSAVLGWAMSPTDRNVELLLTLDLVSALAVWYVLSPDAGIAFLVTFVGILGSLLLPPRAAVRVVVFALIVEFARVPIHMFEGFELSLYAGRDVLTTDLLIGVGVRGVVLLWGSAYIRSVVAMIASAAHATEASEKRFRATFESAPIGMGLFDHTGNIVSLNPTLQLLADSAEESRTLGDLLREDHRQMAAQAATWAGTHPGQRMDIECETAGATGEGRLVALSVIGVGMDPGDDSIPMVLVQAVDITEQRRAERHLSRRLETESVIRSVSTFLVEAPADGTGVALEKSLEMLGEHLSANAVVLSTTGAPAPDAEHWVFWRRRGHGSWIDTPFPESPQMSWFMRSLVEGRPVVFDDASEVVDEGTRRDLARRGIESFVGVPVPLAGETAALFVERPRAHGPWTADESGLAWVVAELLSHALRRQADQVTLERMVRARSEFVARVSHELRTPVTVVMGLASELLDHPEVKANSELGELLRLVAAQSQEVGLVMEDLLVAARADLGKLAFHPERVPLSEQVALAAQGAFLDRALELEISPDVLACADPLRVRQIVRNLLANAGRYGGSRLRVEARLDPDAAVLVVADNGPGIAPENVERVFQPYVQLESSPGLPDTMGLGLSVSRTLARLMGGDLTYRRDSGWTLFELKLPLEGACRGAA